MRNRYEERLPKWMRLGPKDPTVWGITFLLVYTLVVLAVWFVLGFATGLY